MRELSPILEIWHDSLEADSFDSMNFSAFVETSLNGNVFPTL